MPCSTARCTAATRSCSSSGAPHPEPPTAQAPNPRAGASVLKREGGPKSVRAPGRISRTPLGVAGRLQLARLDDLGTMTAGHQFLRLDDLHLEVPLGESDTATAVSQSYGLLWGPST